MISPSDFYVSRKFSSTIRSIILYLSISYLRYDKIPGETFLSKLFERNQHRYSPRVLPNKQTKLTGSPVRNVDSQTRRNFRDPPDSSRGPPDS